MSKPRFKIKLQENKARRQMLERHKRYDVLLNDATVGEIYYNMTGYNGTLPTVHGHQMNIGERGISAYKTEAARINRQAALEIEMEMAASRRIVRTLPTQGGRSVLAISMEAGEDPQTHFIMRSTLDHARKLFGREDVSSAFFRDIEDRPSTVLYAQEADWVRQAFPTLDGRVMDLKEASAHERLILGSFKTKEKDVTLVVSAHPDADPDEDIHFVDSWTHDIAKARYGAKMTVADLGEAVNAVPLLDQNDLGAVRKLLGSNAVWFTGEAEHPDAAQVHQREQEALTGPDLG